MQRTPSFFSLGDRGGGTTTAPSSSCKKTVGGTRTRKGSLLFLLMAGATIALLATPAMADIAVVGSEARRGGGDEEIMKALKVNHHDVSSCLSKRSVCFVLFCTIAPYSSSIVLYCGIILHCSVLLHGESRCDKKGTSVASSSLKWPINKLRLAPTLVEINPCVTFGIFE